MRRILIHGAIAAGLIVPLGYGQSLFDQASFRTMSLGGIHLYGVSVFSGYSTSAYPGGLGQFPATNAGQLGSTVNYGGTATLGWQRHRDRSDFAVMYSGTYAGMSRYTDTNAFSQYLTLSVRRMLTPRWSLNFSATGSDLTTAQFLYQPSSVGLASQASAKFDDLAAAFSVGQFSSGQAASALTTAPALESPARSLLLGDRILSYSGRVSAVYSHSSRLFFDFGSFTAAGRRLVGEKNREVNQNYVMPRTMGFDAGMGFTYQLSPRTQVGVEDRKSVV